MFEEDIVLVYESGPEESYFDLPASTQLEEINLCAIKLSPIFFPEDEIPALVENTCLYNDFLSTLCQRYPLKSVVTQTTTYLIEHFNN